MNKKNQSLELIDWSIGVFGRSNNSLLRRLIVWTLKIIILFESVTSNAWDNRAEFSSKPMNSRIELGAPHTSSAKQSLTLLWLETISWLPGIVRFFWFLATYPSCLRIATPNVMAKIQITAKKAIPVSAYRSHVRGENFSRGADSIVAVCGSRDCIEPCFWCSANSAVSVDSIIPVPRAHQNKVQDPPRRTIITTTESIRTAYQMSSNVSSPVSPRNNDETSINVTSEEKSDNLAHYFGRAWPTRSTRKKFATFTRLALE